ncbi:MAG: MBL fold metallo-hydrolase [Lachnospiraceae bacterium]|nr:MBL fold metallo-hydrolase [Lachnospiraceae bacterium]
MGQFTNPNISEKGSIYGAWKNEFGDWTINATFVNCYLLIGREKAMLIDTACGEGDLRYVVEQITDLPVIVVNTHTHYDHSSGNANWDTVYAGEAGVEAARQSTKNLMEKKAVRFPDYKIEFLQDGMKFDLGGKIVEAIAVGAHHASSFAFLDHQTRTLYSGDELENGQVLLFVRGEKMDEKEIVKKHLANMEKLKGRINEFDRICPAHNGSPISTDYIDDFIGLSKAVLDGTAVPEETVFGFGLPAVFGGDDKLMRMKYGKASFIMSR